MSWRAGKVTGKSNNGGRATGAPAPSLVEGQPFIPHRRFNGIWVPMGVFEHNALSHGAKLLYGRLCLFAGKSGECYASLTTLAAEMRCGIANIGRLLQELEKAKLIKRERRGNRQTATCKFIWNKCLQDSLKGDSDSAKLRNREDEEETPIPQICGSDSADLRGVTPQICGVSYKEEKIRLEKIQRKESFEENPAIAASAPTEPEPTDDEPISQKTEPEPDNRQQPEPAAKWKPTAEDIEAARGHLAQHRYGAGGELPDHTITGKILSRFDSGEDFMLWIGDVHFHDKPRTWGLYLTDAGKWHERRPEVIARIEAAETTRRAVEQADRERRQREQREADELRRVEAECQRKGWKPVTRSTCPRCAGYGRNPETEAVCSCPAGGSLQHCHTCNNAGTITTWPAGADRKHTPPLESWCTCQHAERLKAERGADYCDRKNADAWASIRHQHQSDRWDELYRANRGILRLIPGFKRIELGFACSMDEAERDGMLETFQQGIARCSSIEATFRGRAAA